LFYLTQKQLGELVGVQKAQISRLESNASNVTMDTLMKVFSALKAKVKLQIELPDAKFNLASNL
jgi:transcriptional regulator with XRE-family HTH domain